MKAGEKNLLLAVRNRLRSVNSWTHAQCEIELDEAAPATTGDLYAIVMPGGWRPGPRHNTSGGVNDLVYSVDVAVAKRIANVPRDRMRDVFLNNLGNLSEELDLVYQAIDWKYEVNDAANALILAETESTEGFIEPLRFASIERRPRIVGGEIFAAKGGASAGMVRVISFTGARRITYK